MTTALPQVPLISMTSIEAERIIAVMEDSTEKLSFLDCIVPDVLQHRDELSKFIGDEIAKTMIEQKQLERRYEELIAQRALMKGMINKSKYKEVQDEIHDVSRALRESTNNLVRSLKENPNVSGNLIKVQRDRAELHDLLLRVIQELRDKGTYHAVTHRVNEENNAKVRMQQLKTKENKLRDMINELVDTLKEEQKGLIRSVSEQKAAITSLKDDIQLLKGSASADAKFKKQESLAAVSSIWRDYKLKQRVLEEKLLSLEEKIHTESIVNQDTKEFLTNKINSINNDIQKWESKYTADVNDIDKEIALITDQRSSLLENLTLLKVRKEDEDLVSAMKMDKERTANEENIRNKALLKLKNKAARRIQREMRTFIRRKKEIEALGGGKGKGKTK